MPFFLLDSVELWRIVKGFSALVLDVVEVREKQLEATIGD